MRSIPDPGFAGDDGARDPALVEALSAYARDGRAAPAIAALGGSRLLVPVVTVPGESVTDGHGPRSDARADMAAVLLTGRDGRRALLAFTGTDTLSTWNPQARPVPVTAAQAAFAAQDEGAAALFVDVAGPVRLVVEGEDLRRLADGQRLVPMGEGWAWAPDVQLPPPGW